MASGKITNLSGNVSGSIFANKNLTGHTSVGGGGSGSSDHSKLYNRDLPDQHPIAAITDLQGVLDTKIDSAAVQPIIQPIIDALRRDVDAAIASKAKGLYYDAAMEFDKKPYWYVTSEIDPASRMGTKESIISGPYDLGQGGGGGGGTTEVSLEVYEDAQGHKM